MSSDIKDALEEINHKLQVIVENSFLARLDLIFSVLLSLTIFGTGLLLSNVLPETGLFRVFFTILVVLLAYTLLGELWAIIKEDVIVRFKFWVALAFGISILIFLMPILLIPSEFNPAFISFLLMLLFWGFFTSFVDRLFDRYVRKFPSRFPSGRAPIKAWATLMLPSLPHIFLVGAFFIAYFLGYM